ncbi:MAG: AmmeMemoRadiSam system radical SAM enzyme [Omnitrophica bacterium]|nr:AmmeMemoRadiSam system radical SAM enzyme [Candidatus Omnitrophota bacterium]
MRKFGIKKISRRKFCQTCLLSGAGLLISPLLLNLLKESAEAAEEKGGPGFVNSHEAMFYEKLDQRTIQCHLCPRNCLLKNGMRGICRAREPRDGKHYSLVYGNPTAVHIDPIEKKPLFHFLPATTAFSIATAGCNFRCKYCQNWQISQFPPEETQNQYLPPEATVEAARKYRCPTIAYTYTEPSIFYEYMLDTAKIAQKYGIRNIYHSNGSLNRKPVEELALYLDGANIDLKGFTQEFYSKISEGDLETVLNTIKTLKKNLVHVEITNLMVPSFNDDLQTVRKMCQWVRDEVGRDTPLHFSRFHPSYKLKNLSPTPIKTLEEARKIAMKEGLRYVYIGNVPGHVGENTYCPTDGKLLIRRLGYRILENNIVNGKCKFCATEIAGVWR